MATEAAGDLRLHCRRNVTQLVLNGVQQRQQGGLLLAVGIDQGSNDHRMAIFTRRHDNRPGPGNDFLALAVPARLPATLCCRCTPSAMLWGCRNALLNLSVEYDRANAFTGMPPAVAVAPGLLASVSAMGLSARGFLQGNVHGAEEPVERDKQFHDRECLDDFQVIRTRSAREVQCVD